MKRKQPYSEEQAAKGRRPSGEGAWTFDFVDGAAPQGEQTGTLRELLDRIDDEDRGSPRRRKGDSRRSKRALDSALQFIDEIASTNLSHINIKEPLPFSTLKTIKLLFRTNETSGIHLYQLLRPSSQSEKPAVEFINNFARSHKSQSSASDTSNRLKPTIDRLLANLKLEIKSESLRLIEETLSTPNILVDRLRVGGNANRFARFNYLGPRREFYSRLTAVIRSYDSEAEIPRKQAGDHVLERLHEVLYIYLRHVGFAHFINGFKSVMPWARISKSIEPISRDMENLAQKIKEPEPIGAFFWLAGLDTPIASFNGFEKVVELHEKSFRELMWRATKVRVRKDSMKSMIEGAHRLLALYFIHNFRKDLSSPDSKARTLDEPHLSIVDCVAALCAIRYKPEMRRGGFEPYVQGEHEGPKSALADLMDIEETFSILEKDRMRHDYQLLLYRRFIEFHAALVGTSDELAASLEYKLSRADQYIKIMHSNDAAYIKKSIELFEKFCKYQSLICAGYYPQYHYRDGLDAK